VDCTVHTVATALKKLVAIAGQSATEGKEKVTEAEKRYVER